MRSSSILRCLVVCIGAFTPLGAIAGDLILWSAWIDFASCNLICICRDSFGFSWARLASALAASFRPLVIRARAGQTGVERPAVFQISTLAQRRST